MSLIDRRLVFVAVGLLLSGCGAARSRSTAAAPTASRACILVDTDAALDDFRAMAALAKTTPITAIVVTEGIATPERGAMAVAHLLAADRSLSPPIVVGAATTAVFAESLLADVRANAERLNRLLSAAVPLARGTRNVDEEVARLTQSCRDVTVIALGPWTSFVRYAPRLGPKLRKVVTQGVPLADVSEGRPGFNCRYDLDACRLANDRLVESKQGIWVDVPRDRKPPDDYSPTGAMMDALSRTGMPGTLRALWEANPASWDGTLMSDDTVVVYFLHPDLFAPQGRHVEPTVPPAQVRALWIAAVNKSS